MKLTVSEPSEVVVETAVSKVVAEAENGLFALLPRHADFVAALVPGVLAYVPEGEDAERFLAVDEGVLVKCGDAVWVATRRAAAGELATLEQTVAEAFRRLDEHERTARTAVGRLEAGALRRFAALSEGRHG